MLCRTCNKMFQGSFQPEPGQWYRSHHYNPNDLEKAALEGCYICDVLCRHYRFRKAPLPPEEPQARDSIVASTLTVYRLELPASPEESGIIKLELLLNIYFDHGALMTIPTSSVCTFYLRPTLGMRVHSHRVKSSLSESRT
jgi:hypothetical protein